MLPLQMLLAIIGFGIFVVGVSLVFLMLFWQRKGRFTVEVLTTTNTIILSVSTPTAMMLILAAIYVSGGLMAIGILAVSAILGLLLVKAKSRYAG